MLNLSIGQPVAVGPVSYRISALWEHGAVLTLASVKGEPTRPEHITTRSRQEIFKLITGQAGGRG